MNKIISLYRMSISVLLLIPGVLGMQACKKPGEATDGAPGLYTKEMIAMLSSPPFELRPHSSMGLQQSQNLTFPGACL